MEKYTGINTTLKIKRQRSLAYVVALPDRKCPTTQLGGCQFPTQTISMVQKYKK